MSTDDDDAPSEGEEVTTEGEGELLDKSTREKLEEKTDVAVEQSTQGVMDLLSWVLDTETRARIYIFLHENPESTSEEVAEGTGLYPSTVREALASLHDDETVTRAKREASGAGNNPYEYTAIPPADLVSDVIGQVQEELNAVFNLDRGRDRSDDDSSPVTITVREEQADE